MPLKKPNAEKRNRQYLEIESLQGLSLFSEDKYEKYYENSMKEKQEIISKLKGNLKTIIEIDNVVGLEENGEREFKKEFKDRLRDKIGKTMDYFMILSDVNNSNLLKNKHNNGTKFTKTLKKTISDEKIADEIILMYSQIKNSYVMPKSYLVISVDPYDFAMMGISSSWKTCYKPYGDFGTGPYSAALDKFSFLTYVVTDPNSINTIKGYENKIYRRLGVFTRDYKGAMLSTQYPYKNLGFEEFTINTLNTLFFNEEPFVIEHNDKIKTYKTSSSQVYNDFVSASHIKKENLYIGSPREEEILRYGSVVKCFNCDQHRALNEVPICIDCEIKRFEERDLNDG